MPRRGLPQTVTMRHDAHYVDSLATSAGTPIGRMVPIAQVDPNPDQPRQVMGDLSELMASIAEKGIIEPLIVRQRGGRYQIIAGERRYQAAAQVGVTEVPVVIRDVDDSEVIEIALVENIQRKDLAPFEEAEALHALGERFGYTHEQLARRLGKSRTSVTESLNLNGMPADVKRLCRLANINSKSLLLEVVRQADQEKMIALVERITRTEGNLTRERTRQVAGRYKKKRKAGRPKAFVFNFLPDNKSYKLRLAFRKSRVDRDSLIKALEEVLTELRSG